MERSADELALDAVRNGYAGASAVAFRTAARFSKVLRVLNRSFLAGGDSTVAALRQLRDVLPNVVWAQRWASESMKANPDAARICCDFGYVGGAIMNVIQLPETRLQWMQSGAAAARSLGRRSIEARCLNQAGNAAIAMGRFDEAAQWQGQALIIFRDTRDRHGEAAALGNLANVAIRRKDPKQAIAMLTEALAIYNELRSSGHVANAYNSLGVAYKQLGDHERARESHRRAAELFRQMNDIRGLARTYLNEGVILTASGALRDAENCFALALESFRRLRDKGGEGEALWNLSVVFQRSGDLARAIEIGQQAVTIREEIRDPRLAVTRNKIDLWVKTMEAPLTENSAS